MKTGENLYKAGKTIWPLLPLSLTVLMLTLLFCGEYAPAYATFTGHYVFVNLLVHVLYLLIGIGAVCVGLYFMGLILLGLGQIAMNTIPGQHTFVGNLVMESENGKISPLLLNSIKHALSLESDASMICYLQSTVQRLNKPNEKQMLQRILNAPNGNIRGVAEQFLKKITEK